MNRDSSGGRPRDAARVFDEHRDLLVSVAYRVLGSVTDAEDAVQEAWLRWPGVDHSEVADPRAFLVRVTTRLAIDRLRRVKARRESYVGPWLPESVFTRQDPAEEAAMAESVSMAMLVVLETLSPLERAVFVLREAFGMPYAEIADVLGRREEAVRQFARRACDHVRERRTRFTGIVVTAGGGPISALVLDVSDGLVRTIRLVANPEKLAGVGGIEALR